MKEYPLEEVAEIGSGAGFPVKHQGETSGEFPFFKVGDMNLPGNEERMLTSRNYVSEAVRRELRAMAFPAGTVIFPKIGAAIATNKKRVLTKSSCVDNNVMAAVPKPDFVLPDFLLYWFRSFDLSSLASDANPPSIKASTVRNTLIPLPPLEEQRRIVNILNRAAGIERLRAQASEHLCALIPALFIKMFGDPLENPMGWEVRPMADLISDGPRNGLSPSKTGTFEASVLTLSAITRGIFDPEAMKESTFAHEIPVDQQVEKGRFLVCRGNGNIDLVGRGHTATVDLAGVAFPDTMIAMRPDTTLVCPEYLEALWATPGMRQQIVKSAKTTNGTHKINQQSIKAYSVMLPRLELQEKFAALLAVASGVGANALRASNAANALSDSLMSRLFESGNARGGAGSGSA